MNNISYELLRVNYERRKAERMQKENQRLDLTTLALWVKCANDEESIWS
jgi:hypothetical protein